jgi:hypothetical protein
MTLDTPLSLPGAATGEVTLVPTKKYFKPVVIVSAPLDLKAAQLLKCAYLFDPHGNPHNFVGSHKLEQEISGVILTFDDNGRKVAIPCEKLASLSCYIAGKQEHTLRIRFSAHIPRDTEEQLLDLLKFFSQTNKQNYDCIATAAQQNLFGNQGNGPFSLEDAEKLPFSAKIGRKPGLFADVYVLERNGVYISGWDLKAPGIGDKVAGRAMMPDSPTFATRQLAIDSAAAEAFRVVKREFDPDGAAEVKAISELCDWLLSIASEGDDDEPAEAEAEPAAEVAE